jgi:hypothetical protein
MNRRNKIRFEGGEGRSSAGFTALLALVFFSLLFAWCLPQVNAAPNQCSWSTVAITQIPTPRYHATSTVLQDGRVLITGGINLDVSPKTTYKDAYLYDPTTNSFTRTGDMNSRRALHTATLLQGGNVLIAGGWLEEQNSQTPGPNLKTAEIYDPTTGVFTPLTNTMTVARSQHTATRLLNVNKVLLVGGWTDNATNTITAELFDVDTGIFSSTGSMTTARNTHSAVHTGPYGTDYVVITGGAGVNTFTIYNYATESFSTEYDMGSVRMAHTSTEVLTPGVWKVLVAGGNDGTNSLNSAILIDPLNLPTSPPYYQSVVGNLSTARQWHVATTMQSDSTRVMIAGGNQGNGHWDLVNSGALSSVELFDVTTGTFTSLGNMNYLHSGASADWASYNIDTGGEGHLTVYKYLITGGSSGYAESFNLDSDGDSVLCYEDNCPTVYNPDQAATYGANSIDNSGKIWGDACNLCPGRTPVDSDNDGYADVCSSTEFGTGTASTNWPMVTVTFTYNPPNDGLTHYWIPPDCENVLWETNTFVPQTCRRKAPYILTVAEETKDTGLGIPGGDWKEVEVDPITHIATSTKTISCDMTTIFDPTALAAALNVTITPIYTSFLEDRGSDPGYACDPTYGDICVDTNKYSLFKGTIEAVPIQNNNNIYSVRIDIKHGTSPNTINLGSNGNIPVAIFSSDGTSTYPKFDATKINPASVTLADSSVKVKGKGSYQFEIVDVDGDGLKDMVVHIDTQGLTLSDTSLTATLKGNTLDGKIYFEGSDSVRIVP